MMYLQTLSILNFKNIHTLDVSLSPHVNCIIGKNGVGKTNLLDSIYYLSFSKSFLNTIDSQNITRSEDFFMIKGVFSIADEPVEVVCHLKRKGKKKLMYNDKEYTRMADHIGKIPMVISSPKDNYLILNESEERRKWMDRVIAQYDGTFFEALIDYNRALLQRNALLKQMAQTNRYEPEMVEMWDNVLVPTGTIIYNARKKFVEEITPIFQEYYAYISNESEEVSLAFSSKLEEKPFDEILREHLPKDRAFQYTTVGVHRDDLAMNIEGFPLKKFGSQGQTKTYLLALKLAQYAYIKEKAVKNPILLLDDIFDKLDSFRVAQLVKLIGQDSYGQVFITDTDREALQSILKTSELDYHILDLLKKKS